MNTSLSQLLHNWPLKSLIAIPLTYIVELLEPQLPILAIYFYLMALDLILGIISTIKESSYDIRRVRFWIYKLLTCLVILVIFTLLATTFEKLTPINGTYLLDTIIFIFIITEAVSAVDKLIRLGAPIPSPILKLIQVLRKSMDDKVSSIESALTDKDNKHE